MSKSSTGVVKLRELLFDEEAQRLSSLDARLGEVHQKLEQVNAKLGSVDALTVQEQRLRSDLSNRMDAVFDRAGTRERFQNSIADVLDEVLVLAEQRNHKQVARAVAPLVVSTVKSEIRNSQDEMVEALYPITGRLVQAYVASAMRELSEKLNRRLSQNPFMLRMRSLSTGRPVSEIVMAAEADLDIDEVFLIRRGSGELIARWPSLRPLSNEDIHMGGILSSITDFANHAFEDGGGNIRSFEADTFQIFLRASPMYIIAAKCAGSPPPGFETDFDSEFFTVLDKFDGSPDDVAQAAPPALDTMAMSLKHRLEEVQKENEASSTGLGAMKVLLFLIAVPIFAWLGWSAFTTLEESRVRSVTTAVVDQMPELQGYRTELDVGYRGQTVSVTGLTPNDGVRDTLLSRLRAAVPPTTRVVAELGTLPQTTSIDTRPEIARLQQQLEMIRQRAEVAAVRGDLRRNVSLAGARLDAAVADLNALRVRTDLPDQKLAPMLAVRQQVGEARAGLLAVSTRLVDEPRDMPGLRAAAQRDIEIGGRALSGILQRLSLTPAVASAPGLGGESRDGAAMVRASETLALDAERLAVAVSALRQTPVVLPPPLPAAQITPLEKLRQWTGVNAVFFSNGTQLRDSQQAAAQMDELARLMQTSQRLVRLVGYTDERGGLSRNNTLSVARAERVRDELIERGVPANLLVVVGRAGNGVDISTVTGDLSPNRRVEFEVGFSGENARP